MTEETQTGIPQIGTSLSDIKVEISGTESAPVEQQSTEPTIEALVSEPVETVSEPIADEKATAAAREAIKDRLRAEDAERRLKELQPKTEVPKDKPDINDQKTWGEKYKSSPNDYETFLNAYTDWAMEQGKSAERQSYTAAQNQQAQLAIRTEVAKKEQESRAKHADYDSVINPIVPVINSVPILKDFIARNAMGTEVAYELAKNPVVLERLMRGNVWEAGEQLINMASRLKAAKPVEITKAPDPITPVGSRETVKPKLADLASKNVGSYIETMNKRELAKKRAH